METSERKYDMPNKIKDKEFNQIKTEKVKPSSQEEILLKSPVF